MIQTFFEGCLDFTLAREGGYSNRAADKGGPTNFGITQAALSDYRGVPCSADDVKNLTRDEAEKIYELKYWNVMRLDRIRNAKIALILFDFGVNAGPATSIRLLQSVLNESFSEKLAVDGVLGNSTDVCVATANPAKLTRKLIQGIQKHYVNICLRNPSQMEFLAGWMNRSFALSDAVA